MALFLGAKVTLLPTLSPQQSQRKQGCLSSPLYILMDSSAPLKRQKIISQSKRPHWHSWEKWFVTQQQNPANVNFIHTFQKVKQCCFGSTVLGKQMTARSPTLEPGGVLMQKVLPVPRSYSLLRRRIINSQSPLKTNDSAHIQTSPTQLSPLKQMEDHR